MNFPEICCFRCEHGSKGWSQEPCSTCLTLRTEDNKYPLFIKHEILMDFVSEKEMTI